ncbi:MAG: nucleotidyltransferase family protein, partial [Gammaproteobacteria bacterium]
TPFIAVNADIWTRYDFSSLPTHLKGNAHLVLVDNPTHNPGGDFCLSAGRVQDHGDIRLTFSGIGVYHPDLFAGLKPGRIPLAPILRQAIHNSEVGGEYYPGEWMDIGTPARLALLNKRLK